MKKKPIKNRKVERSHRRWFVLSLFFSLLLLSSSIGLVVWKYLLPTIYMSPLATQNGAGKQLEIKDSLDEIKQALKEAKISYDTIHQTDGTTYVITLTNNGEVLIDGSKNISLQIASLQLIVNRLTMEGKRFSRLDVRYDKPVIIFHE